MVSSSGTELTGRGGIGTWQPPWNFRKYRLQIGFAGLMTCMAVVLLNAPGQARLGVVDSNRGGAFRSIVTFNRLDHGWPFVFVSRSVSPPERRGNMPTLRACWMVSSNIRAFSLAHLVVDVIFGVVVAALISWGCIVWITRVYATLRSGHIRLRESFLLVGALCAGLAYVANALHGSSEDRLAAANNADIVVGATDQWGPTWLRLLIGDGLFAFGDRVVEVEVTGEAVPQLRSFSTLKRVAVTSPVASGDLHVLQGGGELESLELKTIVGPKLQAHQGHPDRYDDVVVLPTLATLRMFSAQCGYSRMRGFDALPELEVLILESVVIDDALLVQIGMLSKLRRVELRDVRWDALDLSPLGNLIQLQILHFDNAKLDNSALVAIGRLSNLTELCIANSSLVQGGLQHLATLASLNYLGLSNCNISDADVVHLCCFKRLDALNLSMTKVSDDGLLQLSTLEGLRRLVISHTPVTSRGIRQFRHVLPQCEVRFQGMFSGPVIPCGS